MPTASKHRSPRAERRRLTRPFGLLAIAFVPFVGCFAEPEPQGSAVGSGSAPAAGGSTATSSGGHKQQSQGGKSVASGSDSGTNSIPDYGGAPPTSVTSLSDGGSGGEQQAVSFKCTPPNAQPLPARKSITSTTAAPPDETGPTVLTITKAALFRDFDQSCGRNGACHTGADDPLAKEPDAFRVTIASFDERPTLGDEAVAHITSSVQTPPNEWMPPDFGDGSKRAAGDTFYDLGQKLLAWEKTGFADPFSYTPAGSGDVDAVTSTDAASAYLISPQLGQQLTNIGSCVPNAAAMSDPVAQEIQQKDALFASLNTSDDLPDTIFETDLVTLDSGALAKRRVFSYAPTYPLYSDNAGKMRYVRVPAGQSIHYDATLRDFVIPDNTRFYKTFLKEVKEKDGSVGYRKMETRLVVARQDTLNADGSYTTHGLRASYAWDKDETMAHRVTDPFRNGEPAADRLCPFVVDQTVTRDPTKNPISDQISETCEYMTADEMADPTSGQIRHYAIPSTDRCDQCHMGSSSHSFVLGFTPWQIDRRQTGEGGIYEEPNADELTQLQRFIDYGIVTGDTPGQVKLEESQLIATPPRSPRNDYELKAQGYMMGNCAFCHNPHGYPVVTNPVLKEFELFPSETGGIFQFPLQKYSPRAKAGASQSVSLPYITAAFGEVTLTADDKPDASAKKSLYAPPEDGVYPVVDATKVDPPPDYDPSTGTLTFLGPWRSLIWRNTYTPFTYNENGTIYIHMPRNASGFDCRASQIMANWMLSIPTQTSTATDLQFQPVTEISATDPTEKYAYAQAALDAKLRVSQYAIGITGAWCPSDDDIVDPRVILSPLDPTTGRHTQLSPVDEGMPPSPRIDPRYQFPAEIGDNVPDHAQWIPTDTTDVPGKWVPRRSNWQDYIVKRDIPVSDDLNAVIDDLQSVYLSSDLETFALEPLPMGLWAQTAACVSDPDVLAAPTVGDLLADPTAPLRRWLSGGVIDDDRPQDPAAHAHTQSRGEAVFHAICQNCHGPKLDSKSALAATILELTGGQTRVANFVNGLFGPPTAPGAYAHDEFLIGDGTPPEDWQARYLLFMGLGGTGASLPLSILSLVATSPFYGVGVDIPGATTPNMLGSAQEVCFDALESARSLERGVPTISATEHTWVPNTGHYEFWESLCSYGNDPVVHVFDPSVPPNPIYNFGQTYRAKDDTGEWIYPSNAPVGNQRGEIQAGIDASNSMPWCVRASTPDQQQAALTWAAGLGLSPTAAPFCPEALFATAFKQEVYRLALDPEQRTADAAVALGNQDFTRHWLRHGAMNAGLSAFYFMRGFTNGSVTPNKPFDSCGQ
jgi:mono/diheme cytochrome c family protein